MATLAIPAAMAGMGGWAFGTMGATIGWAIGSMITQEDTEVAMPSIGDLRLQTSQYGVMIPLVAGKQRMAGNIIWTTDKVAHQVTQRSGGKGGFSGGVETTVTTYSVSMAITICSGPILGITRMWSDGTIVADANSGQKKSPGKIYLGNDSQTPDPTMQAHEGAGNVPSYRGISYIVIEDFDLGASGRVPMFSFEVVKQDGF